MTSFKWTYFRRFIWSEVRMLWNYLMRNLLQAIQRSDVLQCVYWGWQSTMKAENLWEKNIKDVRSTHVATTMSTITCAFLPGCPPAQSGADSQTNLWNTSKHLHFHIFLSTHRRSHTLVWSVCFRGFLWGWWFVHGIAPAKNMHVCMNASNSRMCSSSLDFVFST